MEPFEVFMEALSRSITNDEIETRYDEILDLGRSLGYRPHKPRLMAKGGVSC